MWCCINFGETNKITGQWMLEMLLNAWWGAFWITMRFLFTVADKKPYINLKSMRNGPQEWILQPAITLPHLTLFHWWMPSELTQQDYYSSPQIANKALCHRFPVHRLCACQSLTASWGAIHGWVSRLLPHPLLFFGGSAECFNCSRAGGWIALQHAQSAANNPKLCSCQGRVFH